MIFERLFAGLQHILPQHSLSHMVHAFMRIETPWVKDAQIRAMTRLVGIDVDEARSADPADYPCFNAWFTRELKPGARLFDQATNALLSPSDGCISETGTLTGDTILQAKGHDYSLRELLADDPVCGQLESGWFSTIYLSPRDYHRVHMPLTGRLQRMIHVPGKLFSVAPYTVRNVPRLFARNERVISIFETEHGPLAQVLVGAMLVSSMDTVWAGEVTPSGNKKIMRTDYAPGEVSLDKGVEMGRFNMGSTVILVMPPGVAETATGLGAGVPVKVGQRLATLL